MAKRNKKCPECNGCMDLMWIGTNRYYFCDFCKTYYGGRDDAIQLIPKEQIYDTVKKQEIPNDVGERQISDRPARADAKKS